MPMWRVGYLAVGMAWGLSEGRRGDRRGDRLMTHWGLGTRWGAVQLTLFSTPAITQRLSGARSPNQTGKNRRSHFSARVVCPIGELSNACTVEAPVSTHSKATTSFIALHTFEVFHMENATQTSICGLQRYAASNQINEDTDGDFAKQNIESILLRDDHYGLINGLQSL